MELNSGTCGICDSGTEVIIPQDSGTFWDMICGIFKDELDNLLILKSKLKICTTCIFHARLIDTKKDMFNKGVTDMDSRSVDECRFCKDNISILKVENSEFLKTFESCQKLKRKGWTLICASCYYVVKATFNLRTKLICKLSELKKSSSTDNDGLHSINNEAGSSSCKTDTLKKSRKNSVEVRNDEFPKKDAIDLCSDSVDKTSDFSFKTEADKNHNANEYQSTSPKMLRNKKFKNKEILSHSQIIKRGVRSEEYVLVSDDELSQEPRKGKGSRKKKFEENLTPCEYNKKGIKQKGDTNKNKGVVYSCTSNEEMEPSSVVSISNLDCLNDSLNILRNRNPSTSPNKESFPELKKSHVLETNKKNDLDMSRVLCLMPLSKTNVDVNEATRQDVKLYSLIPYVKVSTFKRIDKSEKKDSDILEHIWTKRPCTSPTGIIKRTPPIKIKLKKVSKLKRDVIEKRGKRKNSPKDELLANSIMLDEFERKKVIVKVERLKLPSQEKVEFEKKAHSKNIESESNSKVTAYEAVLKDTSSTEVTPKKKKKVHFNDTPTIIITGDEMSEDLDSTVEDEDISTKKNTRNGKTLKYERELLGEKPEIEIDSEESGDEKTRISEEEVKEVQEKERETTKEEIANKEAEKSQVMEIEITDDEETNELTANCDSLQPGKESDINSGKKSNNSIEKSNKNVLEYVGIEEDKEIENENDCEAITHEKCKEDEKDQEQDGGNFIFLDESTDEEEANNQDKKEVVEKEKHVDEEKNETLNTIEVEENKSVVENNEVIESLCVKSSIVEKKSTMEEDDEVESGEVQQDNTTLNIDSENDEAKDKIDGLQVVDECSDEQEESERENNLEAKDCEEISDDGDITDVEKKQEDELDADKIVVNDIVLSEATTASEDFGSLIDEVQKCLTSGKDLSSESNEDPILELHASSDDIDKVFEKDDPLSCLNDIDRGLDSSFAENLIDDDKTSNLETDTSSPERGIKRKTSAEDDDSREKCAKNIRLDDSLN